MPWMEKKAMNLRLEFALRVISERSRFGELCREYGISPKTGYKWMGRFIEEGKRGLGDRSRRPQRSPTQLAEDVVCEIVRLKEAHVRWGPRKIRELYARGNDGAALPSESSFKRVLAKAGLVEKRKGRRSTESGRLQTRVVAERPNDVWTVDFKGWWYSSAGERCEPLTVRDAYSRFVLCASLLENARTEALRAEFERLFRLHGLPGTIRSDNGRPFAAPGAPLGLSRLAAWWVAVGIDLDRIDPGHPEQNGGHERMHRDLAYEVEGRVSGNRKDQAAALEVWRRTYNEERPHEALGMRVPAELYAPSPRAYTGTPERLIYPEGYLERWVQRWGAITIGGRPIFLSHALRDWNVGLQCVEPECFSVYFGRLRLGRIDLSTRSFHSAENQTTTHST